MKKPINKPNVIFVFSDQHRYHSTGFAENRDSDVQTPNMDYLAKSSINFTTAISSCPVCGPYRGSLLTGTYPQSHGVFVNDVCLGNKAVSIAEAFTKGGYDTAYIGKWHLDGHGRSSYIPKERRQGFDYWKVLECSHDYNHSPYYEQENDTMKLWRGYDAIAQTDDAIDYMKNHSAEQPFMMMLSLGPPHNPYDSAPEAYKNIYKAGKLKLRKNIPLEQTPFMVRYGEEIRYEKEGVVREQIAGYYAHISAIDSLIGKLDETVRDMGIRENTIFIYTSDHGDMLFSHGKTKKQKPWDESIRVPFLLRYPKVFGNEGKKVHTPLETVDIMPTLLELCAIAKPESVEGESLVPYMKGETDDCHKSALLMCMHPFGEFERRDGGKEYRGLRTKRYTYVKDLNKPWLLYDNERDPYQMNNLVDSGNYTQVIDELEEALSQKLNRLDDEFLEGQAYIRQWGYNVDKNGTVAYHL